MRCTLLLKSKDIIYLFVAWQYRFAVYNVGIHHQVKVKRHASQMFTINIQTFSLGKEFYTVSLHLRQTNRALPFPVEKAFALKIRAVIVCLMHVVLASEEPYTCILYMSRHWSLKTLMFLVIVYVYISAYKNCCSASSLMFWRTLQLNPQVHF